MLTCRNIDMCLISTVHLSFFGMQKANRAQCDFMPKWRFISAWNSAFIAKLHLQNISFFPRFCFIVPGLCLDFKHQKVVAHIHLSCTHKFEVCTLHLSWKQPDTLLSNKKEIRSVTCKIYQGPPHNLQPKTMPQPWNISVNHCLHWNYS